MAPEPPRYQPDLLKRFELCYHYQREKGPLWTFAYFVLSSLMDSKFLFSWLTLERQSPLPPAHLRILVSKPVVACAGREPRDEQNPGAQPFSRRGRWSWVSQVPSVTPGTAVWAGVRPGPEAGASTYRPHSLKQHLCGFATFNTTSAIYLTLSSHFTHLQE